MRRHILTVLASLLPWLLVDAAPAQEIPARRLVAVAPGTTVQVTLAVPAAKVPAGAPIRLEASLTPSAPWSGTIAVEWERRVAPNTWQAWEDKSPGDWHPFEIAGGATAWCTPHAPQSLLYAMQPGVWRARAAAHWHDGKDAERAPSPWAEFEVVAHAGNQQLLARAKTMPLLSPAGRVWSWAVEGAWLGEDQFGCDLERWHRLPAGPERTAAATALRTTLEALANDCPPTATPLAGQHGDVIAILFDLLRCEDAPAAAKRMETLQARWPALVDLLQQRPIRR